MPFLATRSFFDITFTVLQGGSGTFEGALEDIKLPGGATINWVWPRRILKTPPKLNLKTRTVITSPQGVEYMVSGHSFSETSEGVPFKAFRLYQVQSWLPLVTRTMETDLRTGLPKEGPESDPILIPVSLEPLQEAFDRQTRIPNEKRRIVTSYDLQRGDLVNGETVLEVHDALGLSGGVLG